MWVATTLVLLALAPAQDDKKAEELVRTMEDKVHKAKTIQFENTASIEGPQKGTLTLKVVSAEGNKATFDMTLDFGTKVTMKAVSDGKKSATTEADNKTKVEDTPKSLGPVLATMISRTGLALMGGSEDPAKMDNFDKDKYAPLSDFKMGKKEKVGEVEAQAVDYTAAVGNKGSKAAVTVWIDTKTNLPVKRVVSVTEKGETMKITETIKTLKLDEKIDPKTFELPKE